MGTLDVATSTHTLKIEIGDCWKVVLHLCLFRGAEVLISASRKGTNEPCIIKSLPHLGRFGRHERIASNEA
jgi:hypothetical protein